MSTQTVERVSERWNMEDIPDEDRVAIEGDDGGALPKNWGIRFISHTDPKVGDPSIGDKSRFVRNHVVGGPSICNS